MASKSSAVHSIRIPNDLWEWLSEEAKRRELTPNGLVCDLLLVGQLRAAETKAAPANPEQIAKPDIKAAHDRVQKRYPKTLAALVEGPEGPVVAPKIVLQVGPAPTAYGSRLKTPKAPKR